MNEPRVKVLIVDDEPLARALISELLKDFPEFQIIGECSNGKEALKAIKGNLPDLIFLDVQMPEMDGLAVLEEIKDERLPAIIFVTAYDQYAIRAFDFHAIDYLLKPFSRPRFEKALVNAKERILQRPLATGDETHQQISSLLENYKNKPPHLKRLFIKDKGKIVLLEPEKINWIEADDKYVNIHTDGKSYLIRQTLNALEAELDPQTFARIHRSTIVNLKLVQELHPLFNGEYMLILSTGTKLTISRNYKNRFFEQFDQAV
jgi:two-component system LytT family response regulator